MSLHFRFAILSDPHIAIPTTIWDHPSRFHLVEVSIPALEVVLKQLEQVDLDFLLIPGDLTQHGEPENHRWLADRLAKLPYPTYVVPGNHDIPQRFASDRSIGLAEFPVHYQKFGYTQPQTPYYACEILPGVQLIGLNSNFFDDSGQQLGVGRIDEKQMIWLRTKLAQTDAAFRFVMIHHNVIEHLPNQAKNPIGRRYMLENAPQLLELLQQAGIKLILTGHLHVQDIACHGEIYEITTGSLVSYPHPYRLLEFHQDEQGNQYLEVESGRVISVPGWSNLQEISRQWMGDRSMPFMLKLLTQPPLNLSPAEAEKLVPDLKYFWAEVANGDATFHFPHFPAQVNQYFNSFSALSATGAPHTIDNTATLVLERKKTYCS